MRVTVLRLSRNERRPADAELVAGHLCDGIERVGARLGFAQRIERLQTLHVAPVVGAVIIGQIILVDVLSGRVDRRPPEPGRRADPVGGVPVDRLRRGRSRRHIGGADVPARDLRLQDGQIRCARGDHRAPRDEDGEHADHG